MGIIAERLAYGWAGSSTHILLRRAEAIERDLCRKLAVQPQDKKLDALPIHFRVANTGAMKGRVEFFYFGPVDDLQVGYALKKMPGKELDLARMAAERGLGPRAILEEPSRNFIIEEAYPQDCVINARKLTPEDHQYLPRAVAAFMFASVSLAGQFILDHYDEKVVHTYILGRGIDIAARMIDWGEARKIPLDRSTFSVWFDFQLRTWFRFNVLSRPNDWRAFLNELYRRADSDGVNTQWLAEGYMYFLAQRSSELSLSFGPLSNVQESGMDFIKFLLAVGETGVNPSNLNAFIQKYSGLQDINDHHLVEDFRQAIQTS